jgi:UDP-N-acetylglucosamine 2-epimerase (non-hydrolysing)/GDP/UDP-N,N'-diacetylbacillosamine 2-epimerase (hydrolysing)
VAHLHGGEITAGAFDDAIRHAVTKLAHYHFVAAEPYRKRVVQLGEPPDRVFNFGAPGLDHLEHIDWLDRAELEEMLELRLDAPLFLVTYHPATWGRVAPLDALEELLKAIAQFPEATVIFTYPNADPGGRALLERVREWADAHRQRARAFASLGQRVYLSLMRKADLVIGNSSSGLTEAPALKTAAVNIGTRQSGRLKASSVIDAGEQEYEIVAAIRRGLSSDFRVRLPATESLYGSGEVSRRIKDTLKTVALETQKSFFDVEHAY